MVGPKVAYEVDHLTPPVFRPVSIGAGRRAESTTCDVSAARMDDYEGSTRESTLSAPFIRRGARLVAEDKLRVPGHRRCGRWQHARKRGWRFTRHPHKAIRKAFIGRPLEGAVTTNVFLRYATTMEKIFSPGNIAEPGRPCPALTQPGHELSLIWGQPVRSAAAPDNDQLP